MDPAPYGTLGGGSTEETFILVYVIADNFLKWREREWGRVRLSPNGGQPEFTDSEVLTTFLVKELRAPKSSERSWYYALAYDYPHLFPKLISWPRWLSRARALAPVMEELRRFIVTFLASDKDSLRLIDAAPVTLGLYVRAARNLNRRFRTSIPHYVDQHSNFRLEVDQGWADFTLCASKNTYYFGMKLHLSTNSEGVPMSWALTPATCDDRSMMDDLMNADTNQLDRLVWLADKGYLNEDNRLWLNQCHQAQILVPVRKNSKNPWPKGMEPRHQRLRKPIERAFNISQHHLNTSHPNAATWPGLLAQFAAKITALTLILLTPHLHLLLK